MALGLKRISRLPRLGLTRPTGGGGVPGAGSLDVTITPPVMSLAVGQTTYPPQLNAVLDDTVAVGDTIRLQWMASPATFDGAGKFTAPSGFALNTIDATEAGAKAAAFAGLSSILTGSYEFQAWVIQPDNDYSAVSNTVAHGPDVVAPVLTLPTGVKTGAATATVGATTNEGNGALYAVVTASATTPSKAQVKAGQNHLGAAATWAGSLGISATGAKTLNASSLVPSTAQYAHLMHEDAAGNQSGVVSSISFTTDAIGLVFASPAVFDNGTGSKTIFSNYNQTVAFPTSSEVIVKAGSAITGKKLVAFRLDVKGTFCAVGLFGAGGTPTSGLGFDPTAWGMLDNNSNGGGGVPVMYNIDGTAFNANGVILGLVINRTTNKMLDTTDGSLFFGADPYKTATEAAAGTGGADISNMAGSLFAAAGKSQGGTGGQVTVLPDWPWDKTVFTAAGFTYIS